METRRHKKACRCPSCVSHNAPKLVTTDDLAEICDAVRREATRSATTHRQRVVVFGALGMVLLIGALGLNGLLTSEQTAGLIGAVLVLSFFMQMGILASE